MTRTSIPAPLLVTRRTRAIRHGEAGFSLVELAISLTVIGLLLGMIVKGVELLENSRLTAMVSQFNHYETAINAFRKNYGDLPGDIRDGSRLPACDTAYCRNGGNGDGMIYNRSGAGNTVQWNLAGVTVPNEEHHRVWLHLAKAGLIDTINPLYTGTPRRAGVDYPATAMAGGVYDLYYWNPRLHTNVPFTFDAGHYIKTKSASDNLASVTEATLSAAQAAKIDRKMDDGFPSSGRVLSWRPAAPLHCQTSSSNRNYPQSDRNARCEISVRMNF